MKTLLSTLILFLCSSMANAAVVNVIGGDVTSHTMTASNSFTAGPVSESGYTWTSTNSSSVYGYTGSYGLLSNGQWTSGLGSPYVGLNTPQGSMSFTFDSVVSSVLAFVNYAPGYGDATLSIYDELDNLLESVVLSFTTSGDNQGEYWGFDTGLDNIKKFELSNAFIVATDLQSSTALSPVPVPAAAWLFGSALLGFAGLARRKNKKVA